MSSRLARAAVALTTGAGIAAAAFAGTVASSAGAAVRPAAATTSTTLVPQPPLGNRHKKAVFLYVDTVTGGGSPKPAAGCAMTNLFVQGQVVVFRMHGIDVATGGTPLTDRNVRSAYVSIPGEKKIPLAYGAHGKWAFWTAPWNTTGYPVGIVNFTVTVNTRAVKATAHHPFIPSQTGTFSQLGMAPPSQLTIT